MVHFLPIYFARVSLFYCLKITFASPPLLIFFYSGSKFELAFINHNVLQYDFTIVEDMNYALVKRGPELLHEQFNIYENCNFFAYVSCHISSTFMVHAKFIPAL